MTITKSMATVALRTVELRLDGTAKLWIKISLHRPAGTTPCAQWCAGTMREWPPSNATMETSETMMDARMSASLKAGLGARS